MKSTKVQNCYQFGKDSLAGIQRDLLQIVGIKSDLGALTDNTLAAINDSGKYSFDEIADIIQICYKEL